jgi:hypothetical protein
VRIQALKYATADLQFRLGKLGSSVGVLGAALLITEAVFEITVLKPLRFLLEREIQPLRSRAEHKIARTASRKA